MIPKKKKFNDDIGDCAKYRAIVLIHVICIVYMALQLY